MSEELKELFSSTLDELKEQYIVVDDQDGTSIENGQWDKYPDAKNYAMDMTTKELEQAVEGMYHNLDVRAA